MKAKGFGNYLILRLHVMKRNITAHMQAHPRGILAHMNTRNFFSMQRTPICEGCAIGLFWCCIPVPFQMIPATFFCWLSRANLPIALVAVWISNPLTYLPIFYLEYKIGLWLFYRDADNIDNMDFEKFESESANFSLSEIFDTLAHIAGPIIKGGLVLALSMAIVGYLLGFFLHGKLERRRAKR